MELTTSVRKISLNQFNSSQIKSLLQQNSVLHKPNSVALEVAVGGQFKTLSTRLIGELNHEYFVVAPPTFEGQHLNLIQGQFINAKMFDGVEFVNFQTEVIKASYSPIPFLILKRPHQALQTKRTVRTAPRVHALFEGALFMQGEPMGEGVITDISLTGCMMLFHEDFSHAGGEIGLQIRIPHRDFTITVEVKGGLKRNELKEVGGSRCRLLGIAFHELNSMADLAITNYIRGEALKDA